MKIFCIGIKGVGVINIAMLYKEWGYEVLGSDTDEYFFTDAILRRLAIPVVSFGIEHVTSDISFIVRSSAYDESHPQVQRAKELGISVKTYSEALAEIFNTHKGILVTGTHGKTTSAAMLGRVLEDAEFDPTVVVGGELIEWGTTARAGRSEWMVAEGDEYQAKILTLTPFFVLLTNIEYDHPDFYPTEELYKDVFRALLKNLSAESLVVAHRDLEEFVTKETKARTVFFSEEPELSLALWGKHNRVNASGVLALARALGIDEGVARATLGKFRGTKRRMELYTDQNVSRVVLDDYAHHPTEIRATLSALREQYPARMIVACFQAHTYSRTRALLDDFARAFGIADFVIIMDIYASAREKEKTITGGEFFEAVRRVHPHVVYASTLDDATREARGIASENSVFVTLGAGNVWEVARALTTQVGSQ